MKAGTLRGQLMRASMLTTGGVLVLSAASLLTYEYLSFRADRERDLVAQAEFVAKAVTPALIFHDARSAALQLESLRQQKGLQRAVVLDGGDQPFAWYQANAASAQVPDPVPAGQVRGVRHQGSLIELRYPIEHEGERVGTIYLSARHDLAQRIANYTALLGGVVLAGMALAWLLFGRLLRVVTDPLSAVTGVARQVMAQRDWSLRAPASPTTEEARVLVDAFNGMLHEMQDAQARLVAADRKKDIFLATLAHELRNPLAPMSNAIELLQRPDAPPTVRQKSLDILSRQLRHVVRLIDDLLDVSRIATGKLSLKPAPLDIVSIVTAAVDLMEPLVRQHRHQLTVDTPDRPCAVYGDASRLQQVVSNLLTNACRYTPAGGRIDVAVRVEPAQVHVSVSDSGIGIEPSMQQAVFELFEQADKRLERGNSGLGIGLTLARELVGLHGGAITLHSEGQGRGSRFTVSLPRMPDVVPGSDEAPAAAPRAASAAPLRLLVADDNVDFALSLQPMLEALGHQLRVVHDGRSALQALLDEPPDLAILDIGMPGLNGYDVATRLRQSPGGGRVRQIAVSGWGQPADKARAAEAGFDHHLIKPFEFSELTALLEPDHDRQPSSAGASRTT